MDVVELEKLYKKINQFDLHMGYQLKIIAPGKLQNKLEIEKKHLSSPDTCHGGVLAGLMDNILGVTALSHAITQDCLCSTVEFKINYLNPAKLGDHLVGEGEIDFKGKSLVVTSGSIRNGETLITKGIGTFNLYPFSKQVKENWTQF